ncbi:MAG TPA: hypothetical protein VFJ48_00645 [Casimicrobiaceae bacterium]|nr:hypothetical protein [Casimicrobiaceae bacterium]
MLGGAREECAPRAATSMFGQHGDAELGCVGEEGNVRDSDERELIVEDAKNRIPPEVDAADIRIDSFRRDRRPEPKPSVVGGKGDEVRGKGGPRSFRQPLDPYRGKGRSFFR